MRDDEFPEGQSPFSSFMRQRRSRRGPVIAAVVAVLVLAAGAIWFLRSRESEPQLAGAPADSATAPPPSFSDSVPPLDLPALDSSDEFIRQLIARLSAHPQFARWLVTDELIRRFVLTVADLASGMSPRLHLRFMQPADDFRVRETGDRLVVDPASYRRYDVLAETFSSLDTRGTARLVRQLHPLFVEAHQELGLPDRTFDGDLELAIANLLTTPVLDVPLEVQPDDDVYTFTDPVLENRTGAQKHMIRMGPDNARRVQSKLAEIAAALGIRTP